MIRFACPNCSAVFTVGDEKAGRAMSCPKCKNQFQVPTAVGASPPPPPPPTPEQPPPLPTPPKSTTASTVLIEPCPKCKAQLSVAPQDLGTDVECPTCKTVFTARAPVAPAKPLPIPAKPPSRREDDDRPSRRRGDDEDRPSRRSRRYADDDEYDDDRPRHRSRRDGEYADDFDDDRPRRRSRTGTSVSTGGAVRITSAILGFFLGGMMILGGLVSVFAGSVVLDGLNKSGAFDQKPAVPPPRPVPRPGMPAPAPTGNPGDGLNAVVGVSSGVVIGCGVVNVILGALYVFAGIGLIQLRGWGRVLSVIMGVVSALLGLFSIYCTIMGMCFCLLTIVFFFAHCALCFVAAFGAGSENFR